MAVRIIDRVAMALVLVGAAAQPAAAGGRGGGHGGPVFRPGGGFHGGGAIRGRSGGWFGARRGLPPIAGVIHEGPGMRPYYSAYGHTDTALRSGRAGWGGGALYGHTQTALPMERGGFGGGGALYGHTRTALPPGGFARDEMRDDRSARERREGDRGNLRYGEARRMDERRFDLRDRGRGFAGRLYGGYGGGLGYGGFGGGLGYGYGYGGEGGPAIYGGGVAYGGQGTYTGAGTYGSTGTYASGGTYGGAGTYAAGGTYGGGLPAYRSERPLAARFAEPPLAPSLGAPYSPGDSYAYAAEADVGPGPRIANLRQVSRSGCGCGSEAGPVIYRYGIGTAY